MWNGRFMCDGKESLSNVVNDLIKYLGKEEITLAQANLPKEH